mgnify:CR=1 FL=1
MNPPELADAVPPIETTTGQRPPASPRQERFLRGTLGVLVDVTILALFVEHWDRVVIDSYTIALLTAILLQAMLKATLALEHRLAAFFRNHARAGTTALRLLTTWVLLLASKVVILETVNVVFGDDVEFGGLLPFVVLVVVMLAAEAIIERVYDALA